MKNAIVILLVIAMVCSLCACGRAPASEPAPAEPEVTVAPTPEPTPQPTPEPTPDPGTPAKVIVTGAPLIVGCFSRGDSVTVVDEQGEYYAVLMGEVAVLVEKRFIRLDSEDAFEPVTGYIREECEAFDSYKLKGEAVLNLKFNQEVTLLEQLGDVYLIELDGKQAYISSAQLSLSPVQVYYGGGSSGGGGGGGSSDGGEIPVSGLSATGTAPRLIFLSAASYPVNGTVLCDGVEAVLAILDRFEPVGILSDTGDGMSELNWQGQIGLMETRFVRNDSEPAYESWTAYAKSGCMLYETWRLTGEGRSVPQNTTMAVLEDLGDCYLVELEGELLYAVPDMLSETEITAVYYYGGGDSGGGGGNVWTEPAL